MSWLVLSTKLSSVVVVPGRPTESRSVNMHKYKLSIPCLKADLVVEGESLVAAVEATAKRFSVVAGLSGESVCGWDPSGLGQVYRIIPTAEKLTVLEEAPPCADYLTGSYDGPCPTYCSVCRYKVQPVMLAPHPLGKE
jgi:hypothetical protein